MTLLTAYVITLTFHFLFDFVFQGLRVSQHKKFLNADLVTHGLTMGAVGSLCIWFYYHTLISLVGSFLVVFLTHLLIDGLKVALQAKRPASTLLGLDQILHAFVFYLLYASF